MLNKIYKSAFALLLAGITLPVLAQTKIGNNPASVAPTAVLELESTTQGFLPPRMFGAQIIAIPSPATGLIIYCLDCTPDGLRVFDGTNWVGTGTSTDAGYVPNTLNCNGTLAGSYRQGIATAAANTKTVTINVATTGKYTATTNTVNGVTFTGSGTFQNAGANNAVTLTATGTPKGGGTFTYFVSLGGQICSFNVTFTPAANFACGNPTVEINPGGTLERLVSYSGTYSIPYTGGNGSNYGAVVLSQSGLTLSRAAGTYATGGGNIVYTLSGTYSGGAPRETFITEEGCAVDVPPSRYVSTLAGSGVAGFTDGTGTAARFNKPTSVAVDNSGNIYVADAIGNRIRKVTPAGVVTTLAGNGTASFADGTGTAARFSKPSGLDVDNAGNVYVADADNHRIRKVTPAGVVTTLAGNATPALVNGTGSTARFSGPINVAVDNQGNVYVADALNHAIRKITSSGVVSTIAGNGTSGYVNGTGAAARFNNPTGVAINSFGDIYVADQVNHTIRKITPAGVVSTWAGNGTAGSADGSGANARFNFPSGLTIDDVGNIYVADANNRRIRKITPNGFVSTIAGSGIVGLRNGISISAQFSYPNDLAIDAAGNIYVAEANNNTIRKITP